MHLCKVSVVIYIDFFSHIFNRKKVEYKGNIQIDIFV